ncbi:MAG: DUF6607 family protein [Pseudomonadota bacterium]
MAARSLYSIVFIALFFFSGCASVTPSEPANATENATDEASDKHGSGYAAKEEKKAVGTLVNNPYYAAIAAQSSKHGKDHAAILAMQGDYKVDFTFQETVALEAGYTLHDDKTTGGYETVIIVEDSPNKIVLQHILVMGGHVIKHWRQDWTYEAEERWEFVADQTWEYVAIDNDKRDGHWTQCVYEVSDAPRYCGTGEWNHKYGVSTWTSDRSWRPLPRREYTKRSDYNSLNAENRHTITPHGWTHEQDNTKTVRDGRRTDRTLVREFGFNDYRTIEGYDFSPAFEYWEKTSEYWARVRTAWERRLKSGNTLTLTTEVDGMPIIVSTFEMAGEVEDLSVQDQTSRIEAVLDEWTVTTKTPITQQSRSLK